ncbi:MAG: hypothetical protein ACOYBL_08420 [Lachnospiraceae bacterium]|jgi:hypothetical protein
MKQYVVEITDEALADMEQLHISRFYRIEGSQFGKAFFLSFFSAKGKILYNSRTALFTRAGRIYGFDIYKKIHLMYNISVENDAAVLLIKR